MRFQFVFAALAVVCLVTSSAKGEVSPERGELVSIIGGCHDCHTVGYVETEGTIDPATALKGSPVGWQGPWGITYPLNLRLTAASLSEDGFVRYMQRLRTFPPMPWFNVRRLPEDDLRSLYQYIRSLGAPGEQAPAAVPPGGTPRTPFVVLVPPQQPPGCTRDLDCGVGEVCSEGAMRQCVAK